MGNARMSFRFTFYKHDNVMYLPRFTKEKSTLENNGRGRGQPESDKRKSQNHKPVLPLGPSGFELTFHNQP